MSQEQKTNICLTCGHDSARKRTAIYTARAAKKYRDTHREQIKKHARDYYALNKVRITETRRARRAEIKKAKAAADAIKTK